MPKAPLQLGKPVQSFYDILLPKSHFWTNEAGGSPSGQFYHAICVKHTLALWLFPFSSNIFQVFWFAFFLLENKVLPTRLPVPKHHCICVERFSLDWKTWFSNMCLFLLVQTVQRQKRNRILYLTRLVNTL